MAKDTFYFSHDYNTRNDIKIKKLLSKCGFEGYGIFWALIEDLYNNTNVLRLDYETLSFDLRCDIKLVKSIINDFDLFVIDGEIFGSHSVQRRLEERNAKSLKARESILKRWNKGENNTNVLLTKNDCNTIKESKGKEKKEKEILKSQFDSFWKLYPKKADKAKAEKIFNSLTIDEIKKILETVEAFSKYKPFPSYSHPNPTTYLNGKRWEDELTNNEAKIINSIPTQKAYNGFPK